ncbi:MAG TPA: right-handed parallel beta-helix repeat-containing protein, partial [Chthonomonadaceae bacterium]|nr:right-handed parallel beta-helix repeat-containing protein [Chthonomonadaceae bacterium]
AQQGVRALKHAAKQAGPITVQLRGGTYFLEAPLVFGPDDSGAGDGAPILYAAYPGEHPVLSGGVRLTGWTVDRQGRWHLTLPEVAAGKWAFSQLFVADQRRYRPRLPKSGYYFIAGSLPPSAASAGKGFDRFVFPPGAFRADWQNLNDVEALCFQTWTMARLRVGSVDEANRVVQFSGNTHGLEAYSGLPKGNRYLIENVKEALSELGEWYLDRKTGELTYIPFLTEDPNRTVVIAPRLEQLVRFQGDVEKRQWVHDIRFQGITFAHTNWNTPPDGNAFAQAEVNIEAAITAVGARFCHLEDCAVAHTGGYGVEWGAGCQNDVLLRCELTDLGAGGVKIGEMGNPDDPERVVSGNSVEDCLIAHGGRLHPAAVGIWIGHASGNFILHNDITDLYYTGISVGWSWGYGPSGAHHNRLVGNRIWQIGQGVLSDMGGIYTLGLSPGTVLDHNVIHDVESFDYGGWGIYPDEGSTGLEITNNIVYRTKTGGFHQHYGKENVVTNNIFAFSREGQIIRTRAEDHLSFTFHHNIVYFKEGTLLGSNWSGKGFDLDNNIYWNTHEDPITFNGMTLTQWRATGQDRHSAIADPLFVDPENGDFRFKPGSPVPQSGFVPIDAGQAGRRSGKRGALAPVPRAFPPPPPPPPPQPIHEDFESTPVGERVHDAITSEEANTQATVRVSDAVAASGKHSLKFTDAPGQQYAFNPHIFYQPKFSAGMMEGSFSIYLEPGAMFSHEWRDNANPYHTGPSLRIDAEGRLFASGRYMETLPSYKWVRLSLTCGLGENAVGKYDLSVTLPGQAPAHHYTDLACDPEFRTLRWWGFVSDSTRVTIFYIDDLDLGPRR